MASLAGGREGGWMERGGGGGGERAFGLVGRRDRLQPHPLNYTVSVFSENSTMEEESSFLTY